MIRIATIFMLWAFLMSGGVAKVVAQSNSGPNPLFGDEEATKRIDDYLQLLQEGYSELEIFQDLGNANLLSENYESAAFWFEKLIANAPELHIKERYRERYEFAVQQANVTVDQRIKKDWTQVVMQDYREAPKSYLYETAALTVEGEGALTSNNPAGTTTVEQAYEPKLAISANGKVAFFSRAIAQKPEYGIFSKKEVIHAIYRAENINGKWKNIQKIAVCPKYYSAMHPTLSEDGKQLFFASNMPGSFGKYDIYVSDIDPDGSLGVAKNLGPKVNTRKNELYPSAMGGTTLLFASEGRKGLGGLDLFAVQVKGNTLGAAKNLGNRVNSRYDDFAIALSPRKGMGFVVSNRGNKHSVSQYAIAAPKTAESSLLAEKDEDELLRNLNAGSDTELSSTIFEDE
ncbi:MAG: cell envelope biogenesis protein OmpA [Bacteroidota bacterium]